MYEIEWNTGSPSPIGRWRRFETADELKAFVDAGFGGEPPSEGEVKVRGIFGPAHSEIVTTTAAICRWEPPSAPEPLLASRLLTQMAADSSVGRHVGRLRALLRHAVDDGLIAPAQCEALVLIFEQAIAGEGPAGRALVPIADRRGDISPVRARD